MVLSGLIFLCSSFSVPTGISSVTVKGSYKLSKGKKVTILLYNLINQEISHIDSEKHRFEFHVGMDQQAILTFRTDKEKGKSIFINTNTYSNLEKKQQFIISVDLERKLSTIADNFYYADKCVGTIHYDKDEGRFRYNKKSIAVRDIEINTQPSARN